MASHGRTLIKTLCTAWRSRKPLPGNRNSYKKISTNKFRASNTGTFFNSAEYAIPRKEHSYIFPCLHILSGTNNSYIPKSSLSSKNTVCALAERARPGLLQPLSVLLLSGAYFPVVNATEYIFS